MKLGKSDFEALTAESKHAANILKDAALARSHDLFITMLAQSTEGVSSKHTASGESIFKQGDKAQSVYFLKSGHLEISRKNSNDEKTVLAIVGENSFVGEMAVMGNRERSATVVRTTTKIHFTHCV